MTSQQGRTWWERWVDARGMRWAIVVAFVVVGLVLSFVGDVLAVCEDQLASDATVVEVCRQPSAGDPAVLGFLLLLLVGLWPDISEVSFGIFSLKAKVDEQTQKTAIVADKTEKVKDEVQRVGNELKATIQLSQSQKLAENLYVGTTARNEPTQLTTVGAPEPDVTIEEGLEHLLEQPAYRRAGIGQAIETLRGRDVRPVRVALVGAGIDPALAEVAAFRSHLERPRSVEGAPAEAVGSTGSASVGHILAIAPSAMVLPIGVLGKSSQLLSPRALSRGIEAALEWEPDVLLIGLQSPTEDEVEEILSTRSRDLAIVAPAGNDSAATSVWPGIISRVLSVAALSEEGERAGFSNYGTGVELAAPGVEIDSLAGATPDGELVFGRVSGTSAAADLVAGAAALLLATGLTEPSKVRRVLRRMPRSTEEGLAVLDVSYAANQLVGGADTSRQDS